MGEIVTVRRYVPEDGQRVLGWVVETWRRNQPSRQRPRSRDVIRHVLGRSDIWLAVPTVDPTPDADGVPFGWAAVERWEDGSETVHFVYVRGRVPAGAGRPPSPGLRGLGIGKALLSVLGEDVWYTTSCRRRFVPHGWRFDPWR